MIQERIDYSGFFREYHYKHMQNELSRTDRLANWITDLARGLRDYFGFLGRRREEPVTDSATLGKFLDTRASYVAQISLYGYLRTRAGQLYPQLFDEPEFVRSVNVAKWYVWLACLSDLSVFAGGLLTQRSTASPEEIDKLMGKVVTSVLDATGIPDEAGEEFSAEAKRVLARLAICDWTQVSDDETPFSASPTALFRRAPIVEILKELDEEIVRNSVRFRWQEIRRELRRNLNAEAVLQSTD